MLGHNGVIQRLNLLNSSSGSNSLKKFSVKLFSRPDDDSRTKVNSGNKSVNLKQDNGKSTKTFVFIFILYSLRKGIDFGD